MRRSLLVLPLLVLPACGTDAPPVSRAAPAPLTSASASASVSAPTSATAPASASASPSPTPTPTPTASVSASPAAGGPAGPARAVPAAPGDVDGDGRPDAVEVGEQLAVRLSGAGRTVSAAVLADTPPVVAGSEDVDRDGRAEVFVRTARGSSTTFLTPYRWDGSTFAPLLLAGQPVRLGIGGSATHGEGFSCTGAGRLVVRTALRQETGSWDVSATTYDVRGHELAATDRADHAGIAEDDPRVGGAYLVDCRSVGEGE